MTFETADDVPFAGTDATVYVQLFGEKGQTEKIEFRSDNNLEAPKFKRGRIDKFAVETVDVGRVSVIRGLQSWIGQSVNGRRPFCRVENYVGQTIPLLWNDESDSAASVRQNGGVIFSE